VHETAYAKLNLALHVRERMDDGYHRLETVYAFCEDGDTLSVVSGDRLSLDITGPFASQLRNGDTNLVLRAAELLRGRYGIRRGADLTLDKVLPVAAGLGGGSADAAAALRLLVRFWEIDAAEPDLHEIAASLGADVPACLVSRAARGEGRGDVLQPISGDQLAGTPVLLANPDEPLATAAVFRAWDGIDHGPLDDWRHGRNDLEPAAVSLVPEIADILHALDGAELARMSGSGATCFALFRSKEDRDTAAVVLAATHPDWWLMATRLR
jgi:4-diphosphocytidyl-2-C-methyl-D-erythritol kinase